MNAEFATELLKNTILQTMMLVAPVLAAAMVIGLVVSLFQAVTTIHEQTLSFVPKALGVTGLLLLLMPWMLRSGIEYTILILEKIPEMVR